MPRVLIRKKPVDRCVTYTAVEELLTSVIQFMEYSETLIAPVVLEPGPNFRVPIMVLKGRAIVLM
jgi:hypothetical protein